MSWEMSFYNFLKKNPGSTVYDIAKGLGISIGRVRNIKALMEDELRYESVVENTSVKVKIYLKLRGQA